MSLARRLALKDGAYVRGVLRLLVALFCDLRGRGHRDGQQRWPGFSCQAEGGCFHLSLGEVRPWKKKEKSHWEPVGMKRDWGEIWGLEAKRGWFYHAACIFGCKLIGSFPDRLTLFYSRKKHKCFLKTYISNIAGRKLAAVPSRTDVRDCSRFAMFHHFLTKCALSQNQKFSHGNFSFPGKNTYKPEDNENLGSVAPVCQRTVSLMWRLKKKVRPKNREQWSGWGNGSSFPQFSSIFVSSPSSWQQPSRWVTEWAKIKIVFQLSQKKKKFWLSIPAWKEGGKKKKSKYIYFFDREGFPFWSSSAETPPGTAPSHGTAAWQRRCQPQHGLKCCPLKMHQLTCLGWTFLKEIKNSLSHLMN